MIGNWRIHGHAIVSADDRIAGPDGLTPAALRHPADWARFQAELDRAAVSVLGRHGHCAHANVKRRNRIVLSSAARGVERFAGAWWWNPAGAGVEEVLTKAAPDGGIVAVPGGRRVLDLFLEIGFDEFHLTRVPGVRLPDGVPVFSAVLDGETAETCLAGHGLTAGTPRFLDPDKKVELTIWRHLA